MNPADPAALVIDSQSRRNKTMRLTGTYIHDYSVSPKRAGFRVILGVSREVARQMVLDHCAVTEQTPEERAAEFTDRDYALLNKGFIVLASENMVSWETNAWIEDSIKATWFDLRKTPPPVGAIALYCYDGKYGLFRWEAPRS